MSTPEPPDDDAAAPRRAPLRQVVGAVLWSFFGVRKGEAMNRDVVAIRPWQVILVGIAFAALLVVALIVIVRIIVTHAT